MSRVTHVAFVVAGVLVAACGQDAPSIERAGPPIEHHAGTVRRSVPESVDGRLRAIVPAVDDAGPPLTVLLYGDSVAVLVADDLATTSPHTLVVDGVDCRRLDIGFEGPCGGVPPGAEVGSGADELEVLVTDLEARGISPNAAVLIVGNNAALAREDVERVMEALARVPVVWWVTTDVDGRGWRDPNNRLVRELADRDDRAGVIDWFLHSAGQDWRADHVHPNEIGQAEMSELIADAVGCACP